MNRRTVAGLLLIASPVVHIASSFFWPAGSDGSPATQLATAAAHPGALTAATVTEAVGWLMLLPALVVLWSEVRGRGRVLVGIGAWGAVLGVFGFFAGTILNLVSIVLAGQPDGLGVFRALRDDGRIGVVALVPLLVGVLSLVVLLAGLARARLAAWWQPVLGAVAVVVTEGLLPDSAGPVLSAAAFAPMAAALIAVGVRLSVASPARAAEPAFA